MQRVSPPPTQAPGNLLCSWAWSSALRAPLGCGDPKGIGEREEGGRGGKVGSRDHLGSGDQGRCLGHFPHPLGPGKPAGLLDLVLSPPRPEAHVVPSGCIELKPPPPRAFSGPVGPKHRPHPPPKPCPYLSPASPPPTAKAFFPAFFFLFLFFFFYYCGSVLPSSCCFIYIYTFLFFLTSMF